MLIKANPTTSLPLRDLTKAPRKASPHRTAAAHSGTILTDLCVFLPTKEMHVQYRSLPEDGCCLLSFCSSLQIGEQREWCAGLLEGPHRRSLSLDRFCCS